MLPVFLAASIPTSESSNIIVSSGVALKCEIAFKYPSGSGFDFSISSLVKIRSNNSILLKYFKISCVFFFDAVVTKPMLYVFFKDKIILNKCLFLRKSI